MTIRALGPDDMAASWELGRMAFGGPAEAPPGVLDPVPGVTRYGAFDGSGRLLGRATDVGHQQWWGGRRVVAADIGGVAVSPEARGGGVARAVLAALLAGAHERGAALSALYPTVAPVYRAFGWEVAGALTTVDLDTASLPRTRHDGVDLRPGTPSDVALLTDLYEQVARTGNGLLTRRGGSYDRPSDTPLPDGVDAITVAEVDGRPVGVLAFGRGSGYGPESKLDVEELFATRPDAAQALVGVLAGWRTVTRHVRVTLLAGDAISAVLPVERGTGIDRRPWMQRPVDVVAAVTQRGWPVHVRGRGRLLPARRPGALEHRGLGVVGSRRGGRTRPGRRGARSVVDRPRLRRALLQREHRRRPGADGSGRGGGRPRLAGPAGLRAGLPAARLLLTGRPVTGRASVHGGETPFVEGASHNFTVCTACESTPGEFGDTVATTFDYVGEWLTERYVG